VRYDLLLFGRPGATEIILIIVVILILFGAKRIPQLMRSLGSGMREFKKGARGEVDDESGTADTAPGDKGKGTVEGDSGEGGEKPQ
jgi:sec-independent protein translocase protein TatA